MLENFNDNLLDPNWKSVPAGKFTFTESSSQLAVATSAVGPGWENFEYSFSSVNLTSNPTVTIKIKNSTALTLRIDLVDINGKSTNASPVSKSVAINGSLTTLTYDFTNKFSQSDGATVDKTKISKVVFFINPGGTSYSNTITLDDVTVGDAIATTAGNIVLNQVGYELTGTKTAIFTNSTTSLTATTFDILSSTNAVVYTGNIVSKGAVAGWTGRYFWELNFSNFQTAGIYRVRVGTKISYPFEIGLNILFSKTAFSVVDFFKGMRSTVDADKTLSFNGPRNDQVNVYGGWRDATGDQGKHMSHLSYANNFNPQQIPFVVWSLLKSYEMSTTSFSAKSTDLLNESKWGADYLLRNIDKQQGYLYLSIFDDWGNNPSSREITEWGQPGSGNDGARTPNYQAAMREGTGIAIAALARAYRMNLNGDSTKTQYLNGAIRLYNHITSPGTGYATKNLEYCNDHTENIIDFYCGLLATIELYKATNNATYLTAASAYADKMISMLDPQGWFRSDVAGNRPFYHAADEGLPLISLMEYMDIDASKNTAITQVINKNITWYMSISKEVNNPFNYMREYYKPYVSGALGTAKKGFFLPHDNETGYWWQGENARLASMSTALLMAGRKLNTQFVMGTDSLSTYGLAQLDWILGKNPFDVCMMTGAGTTTYQSYPVGAAIPNVTGGICNGISSKNLEETNIDWMPYATSDWQNWRWIEQWLPHDAWYLLAVSSIDVSNKAAVLPIAASFTTSTTILCTGVSTTFTNTSQGTVSTYAWNFGSGASIATATTAGPHNVSWTTAGTKTITLTITGPTGTSTSTSTVTVNAVPTAAGTITGAASACINTTGIIYSIPGIATATGYTWSLPTGATITNGANTNNITVAFATTGSGTIQATPANTCGNGTASSKAVTIIAAPVTGTITGPASLCVYSTGIIYSTPAIPTATSYSWTLPQGANITSGDNTNSITVSFGETSGSIQLTPANTCGYGTTASTAVTLSPLPSWPNPVSTPASICPNATGVVLSVAPVADATSYKWVVPNGVTITNGANTNSITVSYGPTISGGYNVRGVNSCGTGMGRDAGILISQLPANAGAVTGLDATCANTTGITYSIASVPNATGYTWSLPSGATITNGANTNSITVSFATTSGTVQVTPINTCGSGTPNSKFVSVNSAPTVAGTLSGYTSVCANNTGINYSIPSVTNATGYIWTLPTGATLTNGANTNSITVSFATTGGTIQVTPITACGNGAPSSISVTVTNPPAAAGTITGTATSCSNSTGVIYSIPAIAAATDYNWSLPSGATITNGVNTNSITVSFASTEGIIQVTPSNICGTGTASSKTITLTGSATAAGTITGIASTCANSSGVAYSIPTIATATGYTWTLPTGATITNGANTNSITVSFATTGGNIQVTPSNSCGNGTPSSKTITLTTVPTAAGAITGLTSSCTNSTGVTYSIPANATATGYIWTVPAGATITNGANTNSITVSFATTGGNIQVIPTNSCGNGSPSNTSVSIATIPVAGTISGAASTCPNTTGVSYSISSIATATGYTWTVPTGATITGGANTNAITVSFATTGGTIQVTPISTCGNGAPSNKSVAITPIGTSPCVAPTTSSISGPATITSNQQNVTYTVANNSGSAYTWTVPAGATIVSGQGSNTITVSFGTNGGSITVQESNAYGTGTTVSTTVTIVSTALSMGLESNLSVYPNPTNQYSILSATNIDQESVQVSIIDMHGRVVSESKWITSNELTIGEELPSGIYIIQLKIQDQIVTKRWIKI